MPTPIVTTNVAYYSPDIASIFSECMERAGVAATAIGNDHIDSAVRSLALMLNSEWLTISTRPYQMQMLNFTTVVNEAVTVLPVGTLMVWDAVLRRDSRDTPINVMSRNEYLEIPDKTQTGRPDRYFVDRQYNQLTMTVWRTPENNTDQIFYNVMCNTFVPTDDLSEQVQVPPQMLEALHAGLAAKLALKFNPQRYAMLQEYYRGGDPNPRNIGGVLAMALDATREFGDVRFTLYRKKRGRW
jgi:hypothetical protein